MSTFSTTVIVEGPQTRAQATIAAQRVLGRLTFGRDAERRLGQIWSAHIGWGVRPMDAFLGGYPVLEGSISHVEGQDLVVAARKGDLDLPRARELVEAKARWLHAHGVRVPPDVEGFVQDAVREVLSTHGLFAEGCWVDQSSAVWFPLDGEPEGGQAQAVARASQDAWFVAATVTD